MKRTWIKIKCGILEPKHRLALGEAWQLYFYILNIVDWETGVYEEWKDADIANDLDMPLPTLRYQRKRLEEKGYITVEKLQHSQRVIVYNWTNPREYSGEVYNKIQSDNQSNNQSNNQSVNPQAQNDSSFIQSHITHHTSQDIDNIYYEPCDDDGNPLKLKKVNITKEPTHPAIIAYRRVTGRYPAKINYTKIIEVIGDEPDELFMHKCFSEWMTVSQNPAPYKWLFEWYAKKSIQKGWKPAPEEINQETRRGYTEWENS